MPQVRDRAGNVQTVSQAKANQLVATGFYQIVAEPRSEYSQYVADRGWSDFGGDAGFFSDVESNPTGIGGPRGASKQLSDKRVQASEDVGQSWRDRLTAADKSKLDEITTQMANNPGRWWTTEIQYDDTGAAFNVSRQLADGHRNIELSGSAGEWSDELVAGVAQWYDNYSAVAPAASDLPDSIGGFGSGGGGGGGGGGPTYVSPDRRVVEDTVKSMLVSLTGQASESRINELTDKFLRDHRRSWDVRLSGGADIDPNQTVLAAIREQQDYKKVHKLRPETADEVSWISDRVNRLNQLGVDPSDAEEHAVRMAQMGTNLNQIETGQLQAGKGRRDIALFGKLGQAAVTVARQL